MADYLLNFLVINFTHTERGSKRQHIVFSQKKIDFTQTLGSAPVGALRVSFQET